MNYKGHLRLLLIALTTVFVFFGSIFFMIYVSRSVAERKNRELNQVLDQVTVSLTRRVSEVIDSLYDLRGLFGLGEIGINEWEDYTKAILEENHPQDNIFAYVEKVDRVDLTKFEEVMRGTGGPKYKNFVVFPKTESVISYPIKYLLTLDPEVSTLLGFDFQYSERTISAIELATTIKAPALSELTYLSLIIPNSKKTGYEVILPVYRTARNQGDFPKQKSDDLIGFLGAWINSDSFSTEGISLAGLRYSLYDGSQKVFTVGRLGEEKPPVTVSRDIGLLNRKFKIVLESGNEFRLDTFEENLPEITLVILVLINLFWIITVYTIMSSRKRAEEMADFAVRDLRKFKQAVEGVSDQVIITEPSGTIIYANKAVMDVTGYSMEEIMGKKPSLWGAQMPKEYYQKFWKTIRDDKKPFWGELENRRKNGEFYKVEIHVSPILNEKGELMFFVGIERDMSKSKAIEKIKTEFIALASHQLRTPLSAVKWFSEMLLDNDAGKLTAVQKKYVSKIKESNEREIQIVNALLNVSRIESGKIVLVAKQTNLKDLVERMLGDFKVNVVGKKVKLFYTIDKNVPDIRIDPDLIKHVYANLLSNAVSYTPAGGRISVKIYLKRGKVISQITDSGIGIPKAEQDRIFEKFFRASNALKKNTEGTGLGLYLTKTIIESSGGEIWFTSTEGKGTTFNFSLPIRAIKAPPVKAG